MPYWKRQTQGYRRKEKFSTPTKTAPEILNIELHDEAKEALRLMEETQEHIFLTGRAGTGKSTLLQYFRDTTKKQIIVLAPTGVAALNIQGQTIHSFFGFKPGVTPESVGRYFGRKTALYKKLETVVITGPLRTVPRPS